MNGELSDGVRWKVEGWEDTLKLDPLECWDGLFTGSLSDPLCLQCVPGYSGQNCSKESDACQSQPCHNHGTCTPKPGGFYCTCPPGFVGLRCEGDVDECLDQPCHPSGTAACHSLANAFYCQCLPGHTGEAWDVGHRHLWGTAELTRETQTISTHEAALSSCPSPCLHAHVKEYMPQHPFAAQLVLGQLPGTNW